MAHTAAQHIHTFPRAAWPRVEVAEHARKVACTTLKTKVQSTTALPEPTTGMDLLV